MKSEEDEVALVVERGHLSPSELRVVGEEGSKHASNRMSQPCGEVVENDFRLVGGSPTMTLEEVGVQVGGNG